MKRKTIFNGNCSRRYQLWREWDMFNPSFVQFIGLNPSTATAAEDDPTIRRCVGFAKRWGFGALCMTNLFSQVTPFPSELILPADRAWPMDVQKLIDIGHEAGKIICCWGAFQTAKFWSVDVRQALIADGLKPFVLGLNNDGSPKHPLYLSRETKPVPWIKK